MNVLDTKVYFKRTDTHDLLHKASFHPKHTFSGVLKSQLLRFHRICSSKDSFDEACSKLFRALETKHYTKRFLRGMKSKIISEIGPRNYDKTTTNEIGIQPCGGKKCLVCQFVPNTKYIENKGVKIPIKATLDCNSTNVIYVIHCKSCSMQYVGETGQTLRYRFNAHKQDVKRGIDTNVSKHFDGFFCKFDSDCKLFPVESVPIIGSDEQNKQIRLERENFWIKKLQTYPPYGLNTGFDFDKEYPLPFITPYSSAAKVTGLCMKKKYLDFQATFPKFLKQNCIIAYRRNKSLKDLLCSSQIRD